MPLISMQRKGYEITDVDRSNTETRTRTTIRTEFCLYDVTNTCK